MPLSFRPWTQPLLEAVADELFLLQGDEDYSQWLVVLPGARAGRDLLQLLARRAQARPGGALAPPRICSLQHLPTECFELDGLQAASEVELALAWQAALEGSGQAGAVAMASRFAQTSALCAAQLCPPSRVVQHLQQRGALERSVSLWQLLAQAESVVAEQLAGAGLAEATALRAQWLEKGRLRQPEEGAAARVLLAGVSDFPPLYDVGLRRLGERLQILVHAPLELEEGFDEWGRLRSEFWLKRPTALQPEHWVIERDAGSAAAWAMQQMADLGERAASSCVIGVPEESALPCLEAAAAARGLKTRSAAGVRFRQSAPWKLLQRVAAVLSQSPPSFAAVSALLRHPDYLSAVGGADLSRLLDEHELLHLPARFDSRMADPRLVRALAALEERVGQAGKAQPLAEVAQRLLALLDWFYGRREVDAESPQGRLLMRPLEALGAQLRRLSHCRLDLRLRVVDVLPVLLTALGDQAVPMTAEPDAVELIGWLELHADPAPALLVAFADERSLPGGQVADLMLPASLREALQLGAPSQRLARDLYLLQALLESRQGRLRLVHPLAASDGTPTLPSRLMLHGLDGEALAQRLLRLDAVESAPPQSAAEAELAVTSMARSRRPLSLPSGLPLPQRLHVTAFRDYLKNPRLFWVKHVLKARAPREAQLGLDAAAMGDVLHGLCADFARSPCCHSEDEREIEQWLLQALHDLDEAQYGPAARPLVALQWEEVRERLWRFARVQARQRREGWRILGAEERKGGETQFEAMLHLADGRGLPVMGRMDRLDLHEVTGALRVIDYKSGKVADPDQQHRNRNGWLDLQLPLYDHLLRQVPEHSQRRRSHHYWLLDSDEASAGLTPPLQESWLDEGIEEARRVLAAVLDGQFEDNGRRSSFDEPWLQVLCDGMSTTEAGL